MAKQNKPEEHRPCAITFTRKRKADGKKIRTAIGSLATKVENLQSFTLF